MHCVGRTWDVLNLVVHIITTGSKKGYCIQIGVLLVQVKGKKAVPVQALRVPSIRHMKAVRLSALRNIHGTHFCQRRSRPHGHGAAGRIK
jgi:hypothetical protein